MANPYVGPRTFEEKDRALFFGRDQEAEDLLALVVSNRLVLFYAQSGAGKSSLLNTQLIPRLRDEEGFYVLPSGRLNGELTLGLAEPTNIFTFNLLLSLDKGQHAAETLLPMTLSDYLQTSAAHHEAAWRAATEFDQPFSRVLIIDQFEEIFNTNLHRWSQRQEFFQQLRQAMQVDPLLWVVLAMREDYLASVDPYAFILPNALRTRYSMPRLRYPAALHAVQKPATQAGRPFAEGVAEQFVINLSQIKAQGLGEMIIMTGEFVEPVQLQVVCYRLWEALNTAPDLGAEITLTDLDNFGNVDQALAQFYEEIIKETLNQHPLDEITLRDWFDHQLITEANTRGTVYQGEEITGGLPNQVVHFLARKFILRAEIRAGGTWFELVHDRFIEPIIQANLAWQQKQPLLQLAQNWVDAGRASSNLLAGQALQEALASNWQGLGDLVKEYIEASQQLQLDQQRAIALQKEKELQQQKELEFAQQLAHEQQLRLQEQIKANARLNRRAKSLIGLGIISIFLTILATTFGLQAQQNSIEAISAKQTAVKGEDLAKKAKFTAEAARKNAEDARATSVTLLNAELERLQTPPIATINPTPVAPPTNIPTPQSLPTPLVTPSATATNITINSPTPTHTPTLDTTATVSRLSTQIAEIRVEQTTAASPDDMLPIPAGDFEMGSNYDQINEKPLHSVSLPEFYMDKYEVTNGQYAECVATEKCTPPYSITSETRSSYYGNVEFNDYPVINVDWMQANSYCQFLNKRLPTEAEWEKAAHGAKQSVYPWSNDPNAIDCTFANYTQIVDEERKSCKGDTNEVKTYPAGVSPYGIYNMGGNVWEWTHSQFMAYPYQPNDGRENPVNSTATQRVGRGGSWETPNINIRTSGRRAYSYSFWYYNLGFRCAKDIK